MTLRLVSVITAVGACQVRPPSRDLLTDIVSKPSVISNGLPDRYTTPFVPIDNQGSLLRWVTPPETREMPGTTIGAVQVLPPLKLTASTRLRAPVVDQRSCCQAATRWFGLVGSTARLGSTSLLR